MSIPITPLTLPGSDASASEADDAGFGAMSTPRGNLPLDTLDVRLVTTGLSLHTQLTQGFHNPYSEPLEATYVFPLPDRAAVTSMRMEADDRVVEGVLREREQARADYDQAIAAGRRASIAEEERPGVFTMRVGNILPGERVTVRLTLASQLALDDGAATLRVPLVVAPRYIPGRPVDDRPVGTGVEVDTDAVPDASRITPPVLLPGCPSPVALSIEVDIDPAGLPIAEVASSLHAVAVEDHRDDQDARHLRIRIHPGERADRDFVLRLRLGADEAISDTLVVVPDDHSEAADGAKKDVTGVDGDGTFTLTLLPPTSVGTAAQPRDVVFVLDRSGSMRGWKMVTARRAVARIIDTLTGADRFALLAFDLSVETPPALPDGLVAASDRNRFRAVEHLATLDGRGGTEMLAPLLRGTRLFQDPTRSAKGGESDGTTARERVLVLVTDGQVGNEDQILGELAPQLAGVRVHTVGIDTAVNAAFLHRIAALGGGHCELVESEDRLDAAMEAIHRRVGSPVVTDIQIEGEGLDIVPGSVTPALLPSLYAGAALVVSGRFRGQPDGAVTASGRAAGGSTWTTHVRAKAGEGPALGAVWARSRLRDLEDAYVVGSGGSSRGADSPAELEKRIIATSLRFGVLCRFTAYVAVDSRIVTDGGTPRRVTQPVELPQGWELPAGAPAPAAPGAQMSVMAAAAPLNRGFQAAGRRIQAMRPGSAAADVSGQFVPGVQLRKARRDTSAYSAELIPLLQGAAEELTRVEQVPASERERVLVELGERLASLLERIGSPGDGLPALRPLRNLVADLRVYARSKTRSAVEGERLWLRVLDVLGAHAGARDSGARPEPTRSGSRPRADRPRRTTFWRRA